MATLTELQDQIKALQAQLETAPATKSSGNYRAVGSAPIQTESLTDWLATFDLAVNPVVGADVKTAAIGRLQHYWDTDPAHAYKAMGTVVGASGGYLLPPRYINQVMSADPLATVFNEGACYTIPTGESTEVYHPALDQTNSVAGGSMFFGGVVVTMGAENTTIPETEPVLRQIHFVARPMQAMIPVANQLVRGSPAAIAMLQKLLIQAIGFSTDLLGFNGTGVGQPKGFTTSPAMISVTRASAGVIGLVDISKMNSKMLTTLSVGNDIVWATSPTGMASITSMTTTNGFPVVQPMNQPGYANPVMGMFGRPIIVSEHPATLGTAGDLYLINRKAYGLAVRGTIELASSTEVRFDKNQTVYRAIYQIDGQSLLTAPITLKGSGDTISTFIRLS